MPLSGRTRVLARATYILDGKPRTVQLREIESGPQAGTCYVDYYAPKRIRAKAPEATIDPQGFLDGWVRDIIQPRIAKAAATAKPENAPLPKKPTIRHLAHWYTDTIMVSRGNKDGSREDCGNTLEAFAAWCAGNGVHFVSDVAPQQDLMDRFAVYCFSRWKPRTVKQKLSRVKAMFNAAVKRGKIERMPVLEWPHITAPALNFRVPSEGEIRAVLNAVKADRPDMYRALAYNAIVGCRPIDVVNLKKSDVNLEEMTVTFVQQKTGHLLSLPLAPAALGIIEEAMAESPGEYVFTNKGRRMGRMTLYNTVTRYSIKTIGRKISPKDLRRFVTNTLLDLGSDAADTGAVTGHKSRAMEAYRSPKQERIKGLASHLANLILAPDLKSD